MPKFQIKVRQFVEEVAIFTVTAGNHENARVVADRWLADNDPNWEDGDGAASPAEITEIKQVQA